MLRLLLVIPLIGIIGVWLSNNERNQKIVGLITSVINLVLSLLLWVGFDNNYDGFQYVTEFISIGPYHIHLGIDGISLFIVLLTTLIISVSLLASWNNVNKYVNYFQIAFLLIETLLIGVFTVIDLFIFYIIFEGVLIPIFIIIGIWGARDKKISAAYQFFMFTLFGSLFILLGILVIQFSAGTTDYQVLLITDFSNIRQRFLWLAFFLSLAIKTPLVPLHVWLPKAHVEAPVAGSIVLAGVLLKLAGYGYLRYLIGIFNEGSIYFTPLVYILCVISIIYASLTTLRQVDIKSIIAYSSIGHCAVSLLGIFSNTIQGIEGGILMILAHGFVSPALFLCVGVLYDRYHTRLLKYYRGIVLFIPLFSIIFFIFTLANIAVPLTGNFVAEFISFTGAFQRSPIITAISSLGIVLVAAYGIWLYNRVCFGSISIYLSPTIDIDRREFIIFVPLILATLLLGIYPNIFLDSIHLSVSNLVNVV